MNVITNYPHVSLVTTNPATDRLARDNALRPVVPPVTQPNSASAEPAVAGDKEKAQPNLSSAPNNNPTYEHLQHNTAQQEELSDKQDQSGQQQDKEGEKNQSGDERFTEQEQAKIEELKERDREVVAHELAHANAGGQYAGSPSYTYETGPDGVKYAVAGEVPIDTSKVAGDPQATIAKAAQIKRAALAPAEPSGQDRKVAAQADRMAAEARQELLKEAGPAGSENDEEQSDYRVNNAVESDAFNKRATLAQDEDFQQTIANRSLHINAFYQQSSQAANSQFHSQA
ncbi:catalase [Psychrobium sp. MM17-31]|uniref:putative metalloprotease CJM1_0395 family protein n=1 Tax=Psychrobium sp. MM17-31 TaxID=2917758 RepID=UPI001EF75266|nr:putative metalloprotease CJM1_0395 family protein [Psychrobium sp. MM17-31]MCG7533044.1 catalase [Psychrobium sp. MM17-31]